MAGLFPLALLAACGSNAVVTKTATDEIFPVQVLRVQPENLLRTLNAVGTVRYRRETTLGFTSSGKVATVRFDDFAAWGSVAA